MVRSKLARRGLLLGLWVGAILLLVSQRQPGLRREETRSRATHATPPPGAPRATPPPSAPSPPADTPAAPPSAPAAAPRTPEATTTASPSAVPDASRGPAAAATAAPHVAATTAAPRGASRASRVAEVWRLDRAGRYRDAWAIARDLPATTGDRETLRAKTLTAVWAGEGAAAVALARAWAAGAPRDVDVRLVLAEARLVDGDRAGARGTLDAVGAAALATPARAARAAALREWAGDAAGARGAWRRVLASRPDDVTALEGVARTSRTLDDAPAAAAALERLAAQRALDVPERLALADAWRRAGDPARADAIARALLVALADDPTADPLVVADLRLATGDAAGAIAAYQAAEAAGTPGAAVALARAAAAAGDARLAVDAWERVLAAQPDDVDAALEAARLEVDAGRADLAAGHYADVVRARGADGLRVEVARALLAAHRWADAETFARAAVEGPEDGAEARLALAQSVRLQGRTAEAEPLFRAAAESAPPGGDARAWRGRIAMARGEHLAAYDAFGRALDARGAAAGAPTPAELWLLRGAAAAQRGDLGGADQAYRRAIAAGAPLQGGVAREALAERMAPDVAVRGTYFADSNRLSLAGGAVTGTMVLGGARVGVEGIGGSVAQHGSRYARSGGALSVDDLFVTPAWSVSGRAGVESYTNGGGTAAVADLAVRRHFDDTSTLTVAGARESLLTAHDARDPRLFNRIIDLRRLTPAFAVDGASVAWDQRLRRDVGDRWFVQGGAQHYADGNLRGWAYTHYQIPVVDTPTAWVALRPNLFVEAFRRTDEPAYFSPSSHATLGTMLHGVLTRDRWRLEGEIDPQALETEGRFGGGAHALVDASVQVGPARVGASTFAFYDSVGDYWLWRVTASVSVPLP